MSALHAELAHKDAEIERLQKRVERLQELAYAPDGKEHRSMVFAEAAKRLPLQEEIERLRHLVEEALAAAPGDNAAVFMQMPHALAESGWFKRATAALEGQS